jgi:hypothetical protein
MYLLMPNRGEMVGAESEMSHESVEDTVTLEDADAGMEFHDGMEKYSPPTRVTLENAQEVFGGNVPPEIARVLEGGGIYEISP